MTGRRNPLAPVDWYALLAVEGAPTADHRLIVRDALRWDLDYRHDRPTLRYLTPGGASGVGGTFGEFRRWGCWIFASGHWTGDARGEHLAVAAQAAAKEGRPLGLGLDLHVEPDDMLLHVEDGRQCLRVIRAKVLGATVYLDGQLPAWPQCSLIPAGVA